MNDPDSPDINLETVLLIVCVLIAIGWWVWGLR